MENKASQSQCSSKEISFSILFVYFAYEQLEIDYLFNEMTILTKHEASDQYEKKQI